MKQLWILGPPHSWNPGLEIQRWNAGLGWISKGSWMAMWMAVLSPLDFQHRSYEKILWCAWET